MNRTGILGGTFDPPHNVHLEMAERAVEALPLDEVLFVPALVPPHKSAVAPYEARARMVELALEGRSRLKLSRLEESGEGPSYTVDLLERLSGTEKGELYFLLGSDSMRDMDTWKNPRRILELATLVVFERFGYEPFLPVAGEASVVLFDEPLPDVSSSEIRKRIAEGKDVSALVPKAVLQFALDNALYT